MKKYDTTNKHTKISNYTNMEPKVEGEKKKQQERKSSTVKQKHKQLRDFSF